MSIELMKGAALNSLERLHGVAWQMDLQTLYPPLAEVLVWTTAIADFYGRTEELKYSGLAHARNCVLHGVQVVTIIEQLGPLEQPTIIGPAHRAHGRGYSTQWGFGPDPEPHDPATGRDRHPRRPAAYNEAVADHDMHSMVNNALLGLGVNIWPLGHTPFTPRRQWRNPSCEPDWTPTTANSD